MNVKYSGSSESIQAYTLLPIVTNSIACFASFESKRNSGIISDSQHSFITNSPSTVVGSPEYSGGVNDIKEIFFFNRDTISHTTTVIWTDGTNTLPLWSGVVDVNESLYYSVESGFTKLSNYKSIKSFTVHGDAGANFAMTNATSAERFAGNATRHIFSVDLLGYTQVRFRVNKQVGSTSINTPRFRAKYYSSFSGTVGNYLTLGSAGEVEVNMAATGYYDSGWVDLAAGARIDGCYIAFTELGGDGVADPAVGATDILFR